MIGMLLAFITGLVAGVAFHCLCIATKNREEKESDIIGKGKMDP